LEEAVDEDFAKIAAQIRIGKQLLYAVWVDGRDLSYNNFESILPLDRALVKNEGDLDIKITGIKQKNQKMNVFVGKVTGKDVKFLTQLDELGLYQKPSNSSTRGGERFIFSSPTLSKTLTNAIWDSGFLDLLPPKQKIEKKRKDRKEREESR